MMVFHSDISKGDLAGTPNDVVFLLDCDNTLLDNDSVLDDLKAHLVSEFGALLDRDLPTLLDAAAAVDYTQETI